MQGENSRDENQNDDIIKMFQKAKNLADILSDGNEPQNNGMDMNKMMEMFQMAQSFQSMMNHQKNDDHYWNSNEEDTFYTTMNHKNANKVNDSNYEDVIESAEVKVMKAALPFMDIHHRKNMNIFIKMMEIKNLLELYRNDIVSMEDKPPGDWRRGMLVAIRPHLKPEQKLMVDKCIKLLDLKMILEGLMGQ